MLIDSHCHLAGDEFAADLDAVAARAREAGVVEALCILASDDEAEVARAEVVRRAWPAIRFATGVHPHQAGAFAGDVPRAIETVRRAVQACGACAIGEIGLDYHYDFSPRDVQQEVFRAQIRLARELRLPMVIHTREAADDTFRLLREEGDGQVRGVFHCFTGDAATAHQVLALGFHLSYAGIVTFPRAGELREAARLTPLDRILSETDAPYLAPVPHRGTRNEPAFVVRVVDTLADLHGLAPAALAAQIRTNFDALFPRRAAGGGQAP
ncbi:MAG TPA: TatD family hydrolase [Vicinamibacterales bacterium]|nr:TatD family hydrolase [Vicinamibacterales bacterium]